MVLLNSASISKICSERFSTFLSWPFKATSRDFSFCWRLVFSWRREDLSDLSSLMNWWACCSYELKNFSWVSSSWHFESFRCFTYSWFFDSAVWYLSSKASIFCLSYSIICCCCIISTLPSMKFFWFYCWFFESQFLNLAPSFFIPISSPYLSTRISALYFSELIVSSLKFSSAFYYFSSNSLTMSLISSYDSIF